MLEICVKVSPLSTAYAVAPEPLVVDAVVVNFEVAPLVAVDFAAASIIGTFNGTFNTAPIFNRDASTPGFAASNFSCPTSLPVRSRQMPAMLSPSFTVYVFSTTGAGFTGVAIGAGVAVIIDDGIAGETGLLPPALEVITAVVPAAPTGAKPGRPLAGSGFIGAFAATNPGTVAVVEPVDAPALGLKFEGALLVVGIGVGIASRFMLVASRRS